MSQHEVFLPYIHYVGLIYYIMKVYFGMNEVFYACLVDYEVNC